MAFRDRTIGMIFILNGQALVKLESADVTELKHGDKSNRCLRYEKFDGRPG